MRKRIVYTRKDDGGVSICCPAQECIDTMSRGGAWDHMPRGYVEIQIERQIRDGMLPDAAARFARAMAFGGLTEAEALAVIRDRDCAHLGTAIELWDIEDIPHDRWFRDAWKRSHNGGPISIDMKLAKPIQFRRIRETLDAINQYRKTDIDLFDQPLELNWGRIRDQILAARDEDDLRRVWPETLDAAKA